MPDTGFRMLDTGYRDRGWGILNSGFWIPCSVVPPQPGREEIAQGAALGIRAAPWGALNLETAVGPAEYADNAECQPPAEEAGVTWQGSGRSPHGTPPGSRSAWSAWSAGFSPIAVFRLKERKVAGVSAWLAGVGWRPFRADRSGDGRFPGALPRAISSGPVGADADPGCRISDPGSRIRHPASRIPHPASGIRHPASGIRHPASGIRHQPSLLPGRIF